MELLKDLRVKVFGYTDEVEKAKAYCDGYIQGVEDYAREMRWLDEK